MDGQDILTFTMVTTTTNKHQHVCNVILRL